ncbi:MAG TPA: DNA-3-methyladenine glycosylase [Candidatus Limnocylindrales bacterium]
MLATPTLEAGRSILGARLVRDMAGELRIGQIVEVEAYIGEDDRASHARFGRTSRNAVMFGGPGIAYVYLVYGMYDCLNIVTEPAGHPAALLVRAVEPLAGAPVMRSARLALELARRRRLDERAAARIATRLAAMPEYRLASGPGLVAAAFGVDRTLTGLDLCDPRSPLRLEAAPSGEPAPEVRTTSRIGVGYAGGPWSSIPWRIAIAGHRSVSGPASLR